MSPSTPLEANIGQRVGAFIYKRECIIIVCIVLIIVLYVIIVHIRSNHCMYSTIHSTYIYVILIIVHIFQAHLLHSNVYIIHYAT